MSSFDRTNTGTLSRNDRKEKDSHPSHKGKLNVGGVEYWLSAWVKEGANGTKFFSLSVQPKDAAPVAAKTTTYEEDLNDEIPF